MVEILVTILLPQFFIEKLSSSGYSYYIHDSQEPMNREILEEKIKGVKGLLCSTSDQIDKELLIKAGSQLKILSTISVGYDHVDIKYLKDNKIRLGYTPGILSEATAEIAISLVLMTTRKLLEANKNLKDGNWKTGDFFANCGRQISHSTVGIFGLGQIGKSIAEKMASFHPKEIFYTGSGRVKDDVFLAEFSTGRKCMAKFLEKDEFIQKCNLIIVSCCSNEETRGYFDKKVFSKMPENTVFINISRGNVVNQSDLIESLNSGKLFGAGLDVMSPEPIPPNDPLVYTSNCNLLPHIGSSTTETLTHMIDIGIKNLFAGMNDKEMEFEKKL